ncbi:hypothetical protein KIN20_013958 [Parelaphostrongylus tenuis]|nr:hypothetical protein KIN20_013958 [Parelaphostrongylus tenuis]
MKAALGEGTEERRVRTLDAILDFLRTDVMFRNAVPDDIVAAAYKHVETKYVTVRRLRILEVNGSDQLNMLNSTTYEYLKAMMGYTNGVNLLGMMCAYALVGILETIECMSGFEMTEGDLLMYNTPAYGGGQGTVPMGNTTKE